MKKNNVYTTYHFIGSKKFFRSANGCTCSVLFYLVQCIRQTSFKGKAFLNTCIVHVPNTPTSNNMSASPTPSKRHSFKHTHKYISWKEHGRWRWWHFFQKIIRIHIEWHVRARWNNATNTAWPTFNDQPYTSNRFTSLCWKWHFINDQTEPKYRAIRCASRFVNIPNVVRMRWPANRCADTEYGFGFACKSVMHVVGSMKSRRFQL